MATMLQLIQQSTAELGLSVPALVAGNQNADVRLQLALLNAVGYELQREFQWESLCTEYRFSTEYLTTTGTWTTSANTVTAIPTTSALAANSWMAVGNGIPQDTYINSVDSATQVTLSQTPLAANTNTAITFGKTKYTMPSDYDRPIDRTQWDKSKHWEMLGPETAQQWQYLKSGYIATGPRIRFRILGGYFQIWPALGSTDVLGLEYVSKNWAKDASNVTKSSFTLDTDTSIFPDRLLVLGLKLKYNESKNFDTTALYRDYVRQLDIAKANDQGSKTLSFAPELTSTLITAANIPDSNYGA